jgi:hypothetical protein
VASVSYFGGPLQQLNMAGEFGGTVGGEKVEGGPIRNKGSTLLWIIIVGVLVRSIDCFFVHSSSTSTRNISPLQSLFVLISLETLRYLFFVQSRVDASIADCIGRRRHWLN